MILFYSKFEENIKKLVSKVLPIVNKSLSQNKVQSPNKNDLILDKNNKPKKIVKKKIIKKIKKKKKGKNMPISKMTNIKNDSSSKANFSLNKFNFKSRQKDTNIINNSNNKTSVVSISKTTNDYNEEDILNDEELNSLDYENAKIMDKRTFWQFYLSLLRKKHILLFSFIPMNDYNLIHIKICLFLYIISLYFATNTLFFSDSTMNKIFQDKGIFNFLYQLPKILYSTIISSVLNFLIKLLALSEKNILKLKESNTKEELNKKSELTLACLKRKFILFYTFGIIFLIIFWYYVAVFCAVYKNTQVILIEDTLFSILISILYPFALNLIPSLIRMSSFKYKNSSFLYNLSKIISLI